AYDRRRGHRAVQMPLGRVVEIVEVATRRATRDLTLCDKAEVGRSASHIDYATTGHLPGRRLRAHHGGGSGSVVSLVRFGLIAPYVSSVNQRPHSRDRDVHSDVEIHARVGGERAKAAAYCAWGGERAAPGRARRLEPHPRRQDVGHRPAT